MQATASELGVAKGLLEPATVRRQPPARCGRRAGSLLQVVVQDDAVLVVDYLCLLAELDRLTELALGAGAGVRLRAS